MKASPSNKDKHETCKVLVRASTERLFNKLQIGSNEISIQILPHTLSISILQTVWWFQATLQSFHILWTESVCTNVTSTWLPVQPDSRGVIQHTLSSE